MTASTWSAARGTTARRRGGLLLEPAPRPDGEGVLSWFKGVSLFALAGYVFFDRSFAYLHVPGLPVYVGELVLVLAIAVLLGHQRDALAALRHSAILRITAVLFIWGLVRLAYDGPAWGLTSLRDGAMTNYILIGLAVAAVAHSSALFADRVLALRPWVPLAVVIWSPIAVVIGRMVGGDAPHIPGTNTGIFSYKPGDYAIFTAAAVSYVWFARQRYSPGYRTIVTGIGFIGLLVIFTQNRGGVLGALVLGGVAAAHLGPIERRKLATGGLATLGIVITLLSMSGLAISLGSRALSAQQLAVNVVNSITGATSERVENTITWRLDYWNAIVADVVTGDDWLAGVGYGPNLADQYGFQVEDDEPLRNAHNSHVTLVARLGLIGAVLWLAFWAGLVLRLLAVPRTQRPAITGWLTAVILGIGVAAFFDPMLEGPQMSIPFWAAVGALAGTRRFAIGREPAP